MRLNEPGESIVVVPSVAPDRPEVNGAELQAYEERFLFLLLLLRHPRLQVIYVTGRPIAESIIEYYLALLPGVIPRHARARLHLVATHDGSPRSFADKLLERPRILAQIRALIPDRTRCHLIPYATTTLERDLALALGVPLYGADPRLLPLGTKTGCRRLFAQTGVSHPQGFENVHDLEDVVDALTRLRAARPSATDAIVKLNDGVSGRGNATVELRGLPTPGSAEERCGAARARPGDGLRASGDAPRALPRPPARGRGHRRGASERARGPQPERAAARDAAGRGRVALDA